MKILGVHCWYTKAEEDERLARWDRADREGEARRRFESQFAHHPRLVMQIDDCQCLVRDDGVVFFYSASIGEWVQHSVIPGTPAARPKDDDAAET